MGSPLQQPDVEAAKIETRTLTTAYEQTAAAGAGTGAGGWRHRVYATEAYAATLKRQRRAQTLAGICARIWTRFMAATTLRTGVPAMFPEHEAAIQASGTRCGTKNAWPPAWASARFLHSTGQDYKGGPNTGVFLQITRITP